MSNCKKKKLLDKINDYNSYTELVNKEGFDKLDCSSKLSIKSLALEKASKVFEYIKKNFNIISK